MEGDYDDIGVIPDKLKKLRSCIGCGLIMTENMWDDHQNCPNCQFDNFEMNKYTSASFSGMLAIFQPDQSWCAQWQKFHNNTPGLYALDNEGEVTRDIIEELRRNRKPFPEWVERAKAQMDH